MYISSRFCDKSHLITLALILSLGMSLRSYGLDRVPRGLAVDEAGIIYDAWSISLWHRDQFANFMPLSFRSFGDYKPPVMIYMLAVIFKCFGLHESYLRLISACSGTLSILLIYLLVNQLFSQDKHKVVIGLWAAFWFAITPWAIQMSRVGFEQNTALMFCLLGMWLLFKGREKISYVYLAMIFLALSCYTFHTAKIFMPLFLVWFGWWNKANITKNKIRWVYGLIFLLVLLLPLGYDSIFHQAATRASTLIIFSRSGGLESPMLILGKFIQNILNQTSLKFLVGGEDAVSIRHMVPGFGVLLVTELLLLIWSGFNGLWKKDGMLAKMFVLVLAGLLPAMVANLTPHVIRSQFALVGTILAIAYISPKKMKSGFAALVLMGASVNLIGYESSYWGNWATQSAPAFGYGYEQVFSYLKTINPDKVIFSDSYGQPYIYALLYNRIQPKDFLWGALNKYEFRQINWDQEQIGPIFVGSPNEIKDQKVEILKEIRPPNSNITTFVIAKKI